MLIIDPLSVLQIVAGFLCIVLVLFDAFETIVLPRTVKRAIRITSLFFLASGVLFRIIGKFKRLTGRQGLLVAYAPLTILALIGLWAVLLVSGFALLGSGLHTGFAQQEAHGFDHRMYFSGITFFTVGFGDLTPSDTAGRTLAVIEGGTGLGFLALVISYIPVLYQAFSRREVTMLLLDSKAGSNPTAAEILRRHAQAGCMELLIVLLKEWELFSAQLLEAYLSYPVLAMYRSQHDHQSWLGSLSAMLDTCAVISGGFKDAPPWEKPLKFQAAATFAMGRHLVVDLAYIMDAAPAAMADRLKTSTLEDIRREMAHLGVALDDSPVATQAIADTRALYEPYATGLSKRLMMPLPSWMPDRASLDNWQTSAWDGKHF